MKKNSQSCISGAVALGIPTYGRSYKRLFGRLLKYFKIFMNLKFTMQSERKLIATPRFRFLSVIAIVDYIINKKYAKKSKDL